MLLAQNRVSTCALDGNIVTNCTGMWRMGVFRAMPNIAHDRHRDVMHVTSDGNYHFTNGGKDNDVHDTALTENAGSFVNQRDAAKVLEQAKKSKHVDVCSAALLWRM